MKKRKADAVLPLSAKDVKEKLAETIEEVRTGRLDPKIGSSLAQLFATALKAITIADLEQKLQELEMLMQVATQATPKTTLSKEHLNEEPV